MIYTILKGRHRVSKFPIKFWTGHFHLIYKVRFDDSWKQSYPGEYKDDVSKLLGIGCFHLAYLLKWKPPHHWKSTRAGIDYNETLDVLDVYKYIYNNGARSFRKVFEFHFNTDYHIHIYKTPDATAISICDTNDNTLISFAGPPWGGISYLLRPYYGGNNPARIDTITHIKRL